jgi:hypothetical protein
VQSQAKENDSEEEQQKGKQVVIEDDSEEERAQKHTQVNPRDAEKDNDNPEKQQRKSTLEGEKDGDPKNQERQQEGWVSHRHEGAPHQSRVEGANPPPAPLGGQQAGQPAGNQEHMAENVPDFGYI